MNGDVVGQSFSEFEPVSLTARSEILIERQIVFVKFLNLARFDIGDNHVNVFDAGFDKFLDRIINQRTVADGEH